MRSNNRSSGREATFTERARREQVIACTIAALSETGYAATSLASVAGRAGIAKSVVLYYFTSRAGLLEAVVEDIYGHAAEYLAAQAMRDADGNGRQRLLSYVRACTLYAYEHRAQTSALGEIFANFRSEDGSLRYGPAENAPMIEYVAGLLREGQQDGSIRDLAVTVTAAVIRASIDALPAQFASDPVLDGGTVAEHLSDVFDHATRDTSSEHQTARRDSDECRS